MKIVVFDRTGQRGEYAKQATLPPDTYVHVVDAKDVDYENLLEELDKIGPDIAVVGTEDRSMLDTVTAYCRGAGTIAMVVTDDKEQVHNIRGCDMVVDSEQYIAALEAVAQAMNSSTSVIEEAANVLQVLHQFDLRRQRQTNEL